MKNIELEEKYYKWLLKFICNIENRKYHYHKLLSHLHNSIFDYTLDMDSNREGDGINLRYRFLRDIGIRDSKFMSKEPCSVLEMLIALSLRCEEQIMDDPDMGNRTSHWFWGVIRSLGLISMDDYIFDKGYADTIINRFINREYKSNGEGGLFTIPNCEKDMRDVEIWYQMCWYLDYIYKLERSNQR